MRKSIVCCLLLLSLAVGAAAGERIVSTPAPLTVAQAEYHGNRNSHIFHQAGCRHYNCKNCTVVFATRQAALKAGFRPCKICKP
ncbi:Ada metal-binding domain-containing protein [Pseudodesulfovibrio indicus]|jgi:hypothetical protein|uniref:Metal binding Ada-like protein n=1 Tax=Pseudodesulfovibrio indicus TaxID=1716143 RepID=A0AA94TIR5_9BACT|nr:Ada metal-binding domain-containing protein [Pseudodesulfovibrio indicus]TDT82710.1 metal binding Ada-like protein [Pseudodesulfovibrio indicus]